MAIKRLVCGLPVVTPLIFWLRENFILKPQSAQYIKAHSGFVFLLFFRD